MEEVRETDMEDAARAEGFIHIDDWSVQLKHYIPSPGLPLSRQTGSGKEATLLVVFKEHKYYKHLCIELYLAPTTRSGKLKNPLTPVNPLDFVWTSEDVRAIRFFTGLSRFDNHRTTQKTAVDIEGLKAIIKNPLGLPFFYHDPSLAENIVAGSLLPLETGEQAEEFRLFIKEEGSFYTVTGQLSVDKELFDVRQLSIRYDYFVGRVDRLHLIVHFHFLKLIGFFQQHPKGVHIHASKFEAFRREVLAPLEDSVHISYTYLKTATQEQMDTAGIGEVPEKIIYLSDLDNYILINPVVKYGVVEIPVFTKRQIYVQDNKGQPFLVNRNEALEDQFTALLLRQHPDFYEQLDNDLPYFYINRERFMDEDWFLNAFEVWLEKGITVLGFNQLKGNKRSPYKARISVHIKSGINWFNTIINVRFGRNNVNVQHLHKAIRNKNRFIQLDDGTFGILPIEWMDKFSRYFNAGEIVDGSLLTPKVNFSAVAELYDESNMDAEVKTELDNYRSKFSRFENIAEIPIPETLNGTLRHYQVEGLYWLNFLDDFNFGGCLADDMGLGKSIQIIAFILSQRTKVKHNTNLLVVPTSLIFNWQNEVRTFAPSIKMLTLYGADRARGAVSWEQYEIILTSYGTLLSDIGFLKKYTFNYIFLDESQYIKNPSSQRYETVRQLQSRNKIVITGTPVENNTMDLYGQLSFACPGLLGSKQYFKDVYSIPIDRFKDSRRAVELQNKVRPFILRRTKSQVATELPEKTEMILYCPMNEAQQSVYDRYEKEFRDYITHRSEDAIPKDTMHVLKGLTRLRQICNSPVLLNDERLYGDTSSKIEILVEQIENKSPEHKILVFSQFVSMLTLIRTALSARNIPFAWLTGSTRDRASAVNSFQDDENVRVFLISLKAGGTGLNLTGADYVYLVDPWWNPAVENQAIDRSHRIGQKNHVVAVRLICPGTIEEKIMKLQASKKELVDDLIQTDTSFLKSLSKKELLSLLGDW